MRKKQLIEVLYSEENGVLSEPLTILIRERQSREYGTEELQEAAKMQFISVVGQIPKDAIFLIHTDFTDEETSMILSNKNNYVELCEKFLVEPNMRNEYHLGLFLDEYMEITKHTIKTLSDVSDVDEEVIYNIIEGIQRLDKDVAEKISGALGVQPEGLLSIQTNYERTKSGDISYKGL